MLASGPALAFDLSQLQWTSASSTHLVELAQVSENSRAVSRLRAGAYETALGQSVSFDRWYRASGLQDTRLTWMTQLHRDWGLLWGFGTGEQGEKYKIAPSLKLGFVFQTPLGQRARFSIRATTLLGGRLSERPCTADYGDIGGVQQVNCRLAASTLRPADTLQHLLNQGPVDRTDVQIRYVYPF